MNHITRLTTDNAALRAQLADVNDRLVELQAYLMSPKFQGPDADYVHVRTDMLPKLREIALASSVS